MTKTKKNAIKYSLIIVLIVIIAGVLYFFYIRKSNNTNHSSNSFVPKGAISKPTNHNLANGNSSNYGGVSKQNNYSTSPSLPPPSAWKSSSNNVITLQSPIDGSTIKSGLSLIGLASVSQVQFLLIDNSVGQIAQGSLNVVNGKFDGTISFTPHSNSGILQLYYSNPNNGAEEDIININVNF